MSIRVITLVFTVYLSFAAGNVLAHQDSQSAVYVAPGGVDSGRCDDAAVPCNSIAYALRWVSKGGQIRLAEGAYRITRAEDIFHLVSAAVDVHGGFRRDDGFQTRADTPSTLIGVPQEYRDFLATRGFHVISDRKGIDQDVAVGVQKLMVLHQSQKAGLASTPCDNGFANGLACSDVDLLSHVALSDVSANPGAAADVWGFVDLNTDREYAIVSYDNGTAVFDVTDGEKPREVGFVAGQNTIWRDIKVRQVWNTLESRWDAFAYVTSDATTEGLFVIDLSGLPHSIERVSYTGDFAAAHNVYATNTDFGTGLALMNDAAPLIVAGSNNASGRFRSYALSDPASPAFVTLPPVASSGYMHDAASMLITDARKDLQCANGGSFCDVLFDFNESAFVIWDVTVADSPVRLSSTDYSNRQYVHSGWPSEDGQFLFTHDELDEQNLGLQTTLRVFSLADLRAPDPVGTWLGPTPAIDHNGFVRGNRY
ncbi:MAG: choice-of-anchor B family protein, partial [Gammaproteobacteria bacterium]|nr:choice-of-anchor B family protein [Gammaproteobacteria bacterium]